MTDREAFLTRWSRRKREAAATEPQPAAEERAAPATKSANPETAGATPVPETQPQPKPELPPIEAIDASTDIRAFLREGVPQDLARAALRRAWSSDPAIRDFIGLSENSWDFNAPEGVPGFGPFAPEAAQKLVAQVLGDPHPTQDTEATIAAAAESPATASSAAAAATKIAQAQPPADANADAESQTGQEDTAVQQQVTGPKPPGSSA
jgi:Protein of unknown function (DUF3306)